MKWVLPDKIEPEHEPKTDLKYLFRNFVSIILFCLDEAEKEMKEKTPPKKEESLSNNYSAGVSGVSTSGVATTSSSGVTISSDIENN